MEFFDFSSFRYKINDPLNACVGGKIIISTWTIIWWPPKDCQWKMPPAKK